MVSTNQKLQDMIWFAMADSCFRCSALSIIERFEWAKRAGCLSLEGGTYCVENTEIYYAAMQETGLFVHGLNIARSDSDFFQAVLQTAQRLGVLYISEVVAKQVDLKVTIQYIAKRRQVCAEYGLNYLIETHRWSATEQIEDVKKIAEALPSQEFLGDFSHYIPLLKEEADFSFLYPKCRAVHLRVAVPNNVQVEIGPEMNHEGCQLFQKIWHNLLTSGFHGPVVGEIIPHYVTYPRYDSIEDNKYGIQFFRKVVQEAGADVAGRLYA
ncbi:MAG: hypothetical protein HQL87_04425 [Magnetococcales bacterium]|nr:hypothetical protein [Magnetococcales bacterium]